MGRKNINRRTANLDSAKFKKAKKTIKEVEQQKAETVEVPEVTVISEPQTESIDLEDPVNLTSVKIKMTPEKYLMLGGGKANGYNTPEVVLPLDVVDLNCVDAIIKLWKVPLYEDVFIESITHHPGTFHQSISVSKIFEHYTMLEGMSFLKSGITEEDYGYKLNFGVKKLKETEHHVYIYDSLAYYLAMALTDTSDIESVLTELQDGTFALNLTELDFAWRVSGKKITTTMLSAYCKQFFDLVHKNQIIDSEVEMGDKILCYGNSFTKIDPSSTIGVLVSTEAKVLTHKILQDLPVFSISYFPINMHKKHPCLAPPVFQMYQQDDTVINQVGFPITIAVEPVQGKIIYSKHLGGYEIDSNTVDFFNQCSKFPFGTYMSRNIIKIDNQGDIEGSFVLVKRLNHSDMEHYVIFKPKQNFKIIDGQRVFEILSITLPAFQRCASLGQSFTYQTFKVLFMNKVFTIIDGYAKLLLSTSIAEGLSAKKAIFIDSVDELLGSEALHPLLKDDVVRFLSASVYKIDSPDFHSALHDNLNQFFSYLDSYLFFREDIQEFSFIKYVMPQIIALSKKSVKSPTVGLSSIKISVAGKSRKDDQSFSCQVHQGVNQFDFSCRECVRLLYRYFESKEFTLDGHGNWFWAHFGDTSICSVTLIGLESILVPKIGDFSCKSCSAGYDSVKTAMLCCLGSEPKPVDVVADISLLNGELISKDVTWVDEVESKIITGETETKVESLSPIPKDSHKIETVVNDLQIEEEKQDVDGDDHQLRDAMVDLQNITYAEMIPNNLDQIKEEEVIDEKGKEKDETQDSTIDEVQDELPTVNDNAIDTHETTPDKQTSVPDMSANESVSEEALKLDTEENQQVILNNQFDEISKISISALELIHKAERFVGIKESSHYYYVNESLQRLIDRLDNVVHECQSLSEGNKQLAREVYRPVFSMINDAFAVLDKRSEMFGMIDEKYHFEKDTTTDKITIVDNEGRLMDLPFNSQSLNFDYYRTLTGFSKNLAMAIFIGSFAHGMLDYDESIQDVVIQEFIAVYSKLNQ